MSVLCVSLWKCTILNIITIDTFFQLVVYFDLIFCPWYCPVNTVESLKFPNNSVYTRLSEISYGFCRGGFYVISIKHIMEQSRIWNVFCTHAAVVNLEVKCFLGREPACYGCDITSALLPSIMRDLYKRP